MARDNRDVDTRQVIAEVKLRRCLWDSNQPKRKDTRAAAWDEVVVAILGDITDENEKDIMLKLIQQRWKTARDAFSKTKLLLKNADDRKKIKKYIYYDELCFLSPNEENYVEGAETQNLHAEKSFETQNTQARISSENVLKPGMHKRRHKRCQPKPQPINDPLANSQPINDPLAYSQPINDPLAESQFKNARLSRSQLENEPQNENGFQKELLMLLSRQASNISSDDLFFFLSMGSLLNTFDFRQKLEFRSRVLAAASDVQNMYHRPDSSASQSSIPMMAESPEDVKSPVQLLELSQFE